MGWTRPINDFPLAVLTNPIHERLPPSSPTLHVRLRGISQIPPLQEFIASAIQQDRPLSAFAIRLQLDLEFFPSIRFSRDTLKIPDRLKAIQGHPQPGISGQIPVTFQPTDIGLIEKNPPLPSIRIPNLPVFAADAKNHNGIRITMLRVGFPENVRVKSSRRCAIANGIDNSLLTGCIDTEVNMNLPHLADQPCFLATAARSSACRISSARNSFHAVPSLNSWVVHWQCAIACAHSSRFRLSAQ